MLTSLSIVNIVLIERLDLDFEAGLGVLTGETGAGKSILLDALGLALGMRADSALVRQGADRAQVIASFTPPAPDTRLAALLAGNDIGLEAGEPLLIRRTLKADGGSRAFLNDQPCSAALLREVGGHLVEIHGSTTIAACWRPRDTARCWTPMRVPMQARSQAPTRHGGPPKSGSRRRERRFPKRSATANGSSIAWPNCAC